MISELVTLISLNMTAALVNAGQVAGTFTVSGATATTPIALTVTGHNVPLGRVVHGVVSGVGGVVEANGLWILTPTDADTFALYGYTADGRKTTSAGTGSYSGGGTISFAFPDWQVLLGRRFVAMNTAVATPRIVFVPTFEAGWGFEPYGGVGAPAFEVPIPQEVQNATLAPQYETEPTTFEVYVTGAANPPSPDFGDFDATQTLVHQLRIECINACGSSDRCKVLRGAWLSQLPPSDPRASGTQSQRGQQWMGIIQFYQPVTTTPLQYVPAGTSLTFNIGTVSGGSSDDTTFTVTS